MQLISSRKHEKSLVIVLGRADPHGLRVGVQRVRVRVACSQPVQNPYPCVQVGMGF